MDHVDTYNQLALVLMASGRIEEAKGAMLCAKELQKGDCVLLYEVGKKEYWQAPGFGTTSNKSQAHHYTRAYAKSIVSGRHYTKIVEIA